MNKEKLLTNFEGALTILAELTQEFCLNNLSTNHKYIIRSNQESFSNHLTSNEISFHKYILTLKNKPLEKNEVIDLLWTDNKVPLWINLSVIKSTDNLTTIELLTSRRLRSEIDLNHMANKFPPFHPVVPLPPAYKEGEKFDINSTTAPKVKKGLWSFIKDLVR